MHRHAVFGHPIHHSQSPFIHQQFGLQTKIALIYEARLAPLDGFSAELARFFAEGGRGANVTVPFKEQALTYCHTLTERAAKAGAVNTIKWDDNGNALGDNTDGIGLVLDLQRLGWLSAGKRILLVGAGGAARGALLPLLEKSCEIVVANRTLSRAEQLAETFAFAGKISATQQPAGQFDLIINATSSGLNGDVPNIPASVIAPHTACYDMFYDTTLTPFLRWASLQGCTQCSDGLGMLVGQAAQAFYLWHNVLPEVAPVLAALREKMQAAKSL